MVIGYLKETLKDEDSEALLKNIKEKKNSSIFNQSTEILGEEVDNYRNEFKALYFGIKNIILKEIEYTDKDIDVNSFFDQESNPIPAGGGEIPSNSAGNKGGMQKKANAASRRGKHGKGAATTLTSGSNQRFNPINQ